MGATIEELEERVRSLESWAHREALRRGALGFLVDRMVAEQLAAMAPDAAERILADLINPYHFNLTMTGPRAQDGRFKRQVGETASRHVEEVVESIRRRSTELRAQRDAAAEQNRFNTP